MRLLPWWQEAHKRQLLAFPKKCTDCMDRLDRQTRQLAGCGYEPPPSKLLRPHVKPWAGLGYTGEEPTVCPGYSTSLPEVIEIARSYSHWSKGTLDVTARDLDDPLVVGIEVVEGAINELQAWSMDEAARKAKGQH